MRLFIDVRRYRIKSGIKYLIQKNTRQINDGCNAIQSKFFAYFFTPFTTAAKASG